MILLLKKAYTYRVSTVVIDTIATNHPRYVKKSSARWGNTYRHQAHRQIHHRDISQNAHDPGVVAREVGDRDHGFGLGGGAQGDFLEGEAVGVEDGVVALVEDFVELVFAARG